MDNRDVKTIDNGAVLQAGEREAAEYYPVVENEDALWVKSIFNRVMDFLFPQHLVCHCCDREEVVNEYGICKRCENSLKLVSSVGGVSNVDGVTSGLLYEEPVAQAVRTFKYNGKLYKKELLVHFMKIPHSWEFDYVVPIPLHPKRLRERGYNQSEVLAKELCRRYGFSLRLDCVIRKRYTPKQANLNAVERIKNVKGVFEASKECKGKSFLLVDDVRTTGVTLAECAYALKRKGAVRVYAITACCDLIPGSGKVKRQPVKRQESKPAVT